jgi:hypothetical protein
MPAARRCQLASHRRQGDPAASLYILISGRARLVRQDSLPNGGARVEDEVCGVTTSHGYQVCI